MRPQGNVLNVARFHVQLAMANASVVVSPSVLNAPSSFKVKLEANGVTGCVEHVQRKYGGKRCGPKLAGELRQFLL